MKVRIANYTFTAASKTISFDDYVSIDIEAVLLVTNIVDGIIIYDFSDPTLVGTVATNVLTLVYDTTGMSDTDELQIWYWDETAAQDVNVTGGSVTVTGGLTDTELRATPVPVSGTVTTTATNLDIRDLAFASDKVDASGTVLGAGTNNIGDVDVLTLPALPTGANVIGKVKITDGTDDADVLDLTNSNPLTVAIVDNNGDQISSFGGGVEYTEGDTDASITGKAILWEDASDTLRTVSATKPLPIDVKNASIPVTGTFWQATQPVSGPLTDAQLRATPVPISGTLATTATDLDIRDLVFATDKVDVSGSSIDVVPIPVTTVTGTITTQDIAVAATWSGAIVSGTPTAGSTVSTQVPDGSSIFVVQVSGLASNSEAMFEASLNSTDGINGDWVGREAYFVGGEAPQYDIYASPPGGVYAGYILNAKWFRVRQLDDTGTIDVIITFSSNTDILNSDQKYLQDIFNYVASLTNTTYSEDDAPLFSTGKRIFGRRNDAAIVITDTDRDITDISTDSAGRIGITDLGGSITIDNTNLDTPLSTLNTTINSLLKPASTLAAVTSITNVVHVDDNGGNISIDDGGNSITVDGTVAIGAGSAVIGHVIADSGSTTAVTGNVTVIQGTATNLKVQAENYVGGTIVSNANPIPISDAGGSLTIDGTVAFSNTTIAVTNAGTFVTQPTLQAGTAYVGKVRLTDGTTDGEVVPLAGYNAQAVAIVDGSGNQITSFGGGTQYTEGDTDASITGTALLWEDTSDTLRAVSVAKPLPVNFTNTTIAVTNAGTFVTQSTLAAETTKVIGTVRTSDGSGNLYTSNSTTYTAKFAQDGNLLGTLGTAFSTAGKVDIKAADGDVFVRQTTASNLNMTEASAANILTKLTAGAASMVKLEDVAAVDGDAGTPAMAIRKATPANTSNADGDYEFLQMNNGALWTTELGFPVSIQTDVTRQAADTTQYTINDAISNSTSAPTSGGFTFTGAARKSGGSGVITDVIISSSASPATTLQGELIIFNQSVTNINDNVAFVVSDAEIKTCVAKIPFTLEDMGNNSMYHAQNLAIVFTASGSADLRFLLRAKNAYTPVGSEVLTFTIKVLQID